jgi:type VI protein secretion system component VasF
MVGDTLRQGAQRRDYLQSWQLLSADRRKDRSDLPLNPAAAWSIALFTSLALWWGIWLAVSSLVSAVR